MGYFPTYTLGNLHAAQLFEAACSAHPGLVDGFSRGEFDPLREWLNTNVHAEGKRYAALELTEKRPGKPLSAEPLMRHLESKLLPLYGLDLSQLLFLNGELLRDSSAIRQNVIHPFQRLHGCPIAGGLVWIGVALDEQASTPAATADRANRGAISGRPAVTPAFAPGRWVEWVTSKQTGTPEVTHFCQCGEIVDQVGCSQRMFHVR